MAANVLNSRQAIEMSVFVVRAFIKMREQLLNRAELEKRLAEIEKALLSHDAALRNLYRKIRPLLLPPLEPEDFGPTLRGCVLSRLIQPLFHVQKPGLEQTPGLFDSQAAA